MKHICFKLNVTPKDRNYFVQKYVVISQHELVFISFGNVIDQEAGFDQWTTMRHYFLTADAYKQFLTKLMDERLSEFAFEV